MSERIYLTYTNASAVPHVGTPIAHHVVINYVDSNGNHYTLQGIPQHKFEHNAEKARAFLSEEGLSSGEENTDSPFGRLQAIGLRSADDGLPVPHTVIAEGDDLSSQWNRMVDFENEMNSTGYEYRPYSQNSNSFAAGALRRAGLLGPGTAHPESFDRLIAIDPATGESSSVFVPGFDRRLTNPINEFDNRFGRWTRSPGGTAPQNPDQPPVFDTNAPAIPFVVPNEARSANGPASFGDRLAAGFLPPR